MLRNWQVCLAEVAFIISVTTYNITIQPVPVPNNYDCSEFLHLKCILLPKISSE